MNQEHPTWCAPRRCRAAVSGTHKSKLVEAIDGANRTSAWLQQHLDDQVLLALVTAHQGIAAPVAYLPLSNARTLLDATCELVEQADDHGTTRS